MPLREKIEALSSRACGSFCSEDRALFDEFKLALNRGEVRAAERTPDGAWNVNSWVKQGILVGFRMGQLVDMSASSVLRFFDKETYRTRPTTLNENIRIVPGGSSIREGAYIASGVVCMPPMYVNVGAYVDEGTMIDSHVLVGGGCGVYEGTIVRERAVLAAGTILTGSTPVYDLVREKIYQRTAEAPLEIPAGAVIVPGARNVRSEAGRAWGLSLYAPVIVKYRDEKTDAAVQLEDYLR